MQKKNILLYLFIISVFSAIAQESYNNCANAITLCPGKTFTLNNINANATVCSNCEDDFSYCFSGENTIWMTFTTNPSGGDVALLFNNLQFQTNPGQGSALQAAIIQANLPCISSSYSLLSNCESNGTSNFTLSANGLLGNTTYYVVVNGKMGTTSNAEASFDVALSGSAVDRNPTFSISTSTTSICKGNTATFTAQTSGCSNQSNFNWYVNDSLVGSTQNPTFSYNHLSNNDKVTATVTCFSHCQDTLTSNFYIFAVADFLVDAGKDVHINQGETVQLNGQTNQSSILWSPPYAMNNPNTIRPIVQPKETTTYFLTVSNGNCSITDEVTVFVDKGLVIPNTFSPNGDGVNDDWEILGIQNYPNCHIQVYDRWGQLVFQTSGYPQNKRWKGTSKSGKNLSAGAYYYVIDLHNNDKSKPIKGVVSIIH